MILDIQQWLLSLLKHNRQYRKDKPVPTIVILIFLNRSKQLVFLNERA